MSHDFSGKIVLVTGANKGIGFEIARKLGALGFIVLLGARDATKGEAAAARLRSEGIDVRVLHLDVTNPATIEEAAKFIGEKFGRLDVLVNNAGVLPDREPPSRAPLTGVRQVFETNFFGVIAVTQAMLPLLRKSAAARIVNLSSAIGSLTMHSDPASGFRQEWNVLGYNSSKTALNAFTVFLANELHDTAIKVNSADPGYCKTDMNYNTGPRDPAEGAETAVWLATLPADGPTGGFFYDRQPLPF